MNIDVEQRIKELQKDSKFFFKQTEEIIDMVYRLAVQDCNSEMPPECFTSKITQEINDKIADKLIFNEKAISEERDLRAELDDALNVIKKQDETIEDQEKTIKKLNSQICDLNNKKKTLPKKSEELETPRIMNNQFQSGMVSGLKYSIMAMEGHNLDEAFRIIIGKYNEVSKPQKQYWP